MHVSDKTTPNSTSPFAPGPSDSMYSREPSCEFRDDVWLEQFMARRADVQSQQTMIRTEALFFLVTLLKVFCVCLQRGQRGLLPLVRLLHTPDGGVRLQSQQLTWMWPRPNNLSTPVPFSSFSVSSSLSLLPSHLDASVGFGGFRWDAELFLFQLAKLRWFIFTQTCE